MPLNFSANFSTRGKLVFKKKLNKTVTYHDPCCLARFTYVLDAPRRLLAALCASPLVEMNWSGKQARSCGGCGGVPFTYPDISEKAGRLRVEEALKTKARILASADPECELMLSRVAKEIEVKITPARIPQRITRNTAIVVSPHQGTGFPPALY